ncbi:MAG: hypothetical protein ACKOC8_11585 [Pirellulales bacterium]
MRRSRGRRWAMVALGGCVLASLAAVAGAAGGLWKGTCAKCGHDWVRYAPPTDAYSICTFRSDDRGWCSGRIIWEREAVKK